jgi:epoxyqueuosine reductase QueG
MKGDINHKTVAAIAGVGSIGLSRLLVTACRDACPVEAIKEDGTLDYRACAVNTLRNGIPGLIASTRKLAGADEKGVKGIVYGADFWEIWQATVSSSIYSCSECMGSCPAGSK